MNKILDEELTNVSAGGSGTLPKGGIIYSEYSELLPQYYYSQRQDLAEVVYVYSVGGQLFYTREAFSIDPSTNTWASRCRTSSGTRCPIENIPGFMYRYKYRLNIKL